MLMERNQYKERFMELQEAVRSVNYQHDMEHFHGLILTIIGIISCL